MCIRDRYNAAAAAATAAGNTALAQQYAAAAASATGVAIKTADKELDCDQTGWGITPIIGADFKMNRLNIGVKYELKTKLNIEKKKKKKKKKKKNEQKQIIKKKKKKKNIKAKKNLI
eukprot:TRINITY_DN16984_c0_g1_i2.p2 TRINITY_DN16984_c0_g1~~TRINITY_DN16984_c0_g1_i2.p2  ORF type:complete len:117 (+),score=45.63 TRINITY_DN16984_c0_g1_i2:144-494(+)